MGEQEAEFIHAHINQLEAQFSGIVNPLERLKYVIKKHNVESSPHLNSLKPTKNTRKKIKLV